MRRVIVRHGNGRGDDGAILVMVALLMVALIGMAALVVDVGALVQERRTLQNGADAAAMAVALDCAKGACGAAAATADTYADLNADDSLANIAEVCGSGPGLSGCSGSAPAGVGSGWVRVTTSTAASGGSTIVRFVFGPVIGGGSGRTVTRTAIATWGTVSQVTTLPLTISACEFNALVGDVDDLPSGPHFIYFHNATGGVTPATCPAGAAGSDNPISGGFGWLSNSSGCSVTISSGGWVNDKPGNAPPAGCDLASLQNKEIVMPIYDGTNGLNGANGRYHISGFALFKVEGYKFAGGGQAWNMGSPARCPLGTGANAVCLKGTFKAYATNIGTFTGTGTDYGVTVTKLIG